MVVGARKDVPLYPLPVAVAVHVCARITQPGSSVVFKTPLLSAYTRRFAVPASALTLTEPPTLRVLVGFDVPIPTFAPNGLIHKGAQDERAALCPPMVAILFN